MTKPKHTKGPWIAMTHESKGAVLSHPDGKLIAECDSRNVDLIATAPELLEAAEEMYELCRNYFEDGWNTLVDTYGDATGDAIKNLEDVIRRAKGGES